MQREAPARSGVGAGRSRSFGPWAAAGRLRNRLGRPGVCVGAAPRRSWGGEIGEIALK